MNNPVGHGHDYNIGRFNLLTSLLAIINTNDENETDFLIAKFFIMNLNQLKKLSIYEIADACYVSRSSVQRFIKNIGYDSFNQLKSNLDLTILHKKALSIILTKPITNIV